MKFLRLNDHGKKYFALMHKHLVSKCTNLLLNRKKVRMLGRFSDLRKISSSMINQKLISFCNFLYRCGLMYNRYLDIRQHFLRYVAVKLLERKARVTTVITMNKLSLQIRILRTSVDPEFIRLTSSKCAYLSLSSHCCVNTNIQV